MTYVVCRYILSITFHFSGKTCPEDGKLDQSGGNPGGDQEAGEDVVELVPENHCSTAGPPALTVDVGQLPPSWLIGRAGPLWQQLLSLLEQLWDEDWLLEVATHQGSQVGVGPGAA